MESVAGFHPSLARYGQLVPRAIHAPVGQRERRLHRVEATWERDIHAPDDSPGARLHRVGRKGSPSLRVALAGSNPS